MITNYRPFRSISYRFRDKNFFSKKCQNSQSSSRFTDILQSNLVKEDIKVILQNNYPVDQSGADKIGSDLTTLIQKSAKISLKRKRSFKHSNKLKHKFKNTELQLLYYKIKKDLNNLAYLLKKYPNDPYIRGRFFTEKKNIKKFVKNAESEQRNAILNKIKTAEEKNPTAFWKLINSIKGARTKNENLEPEILYNYFKNLHDKKVSNKFDQNFEKLIIKKLNTLMIKKL